MLNRIGSAVADVLWYFRYCTLWNIWRRAGRPELPVLAREGSHPCRPTVYVCSRVIWRPILSVYLRNPRIRVHTECIRCEYGMHTKCIRNAYQLGTSRICRRWACLAPETAAERALTRRQWPCPPQTGPRRARTHVIGPDMRERPCPTVHSRAQDTQHALNRVRRRA